MASKRQQVVDALEARLKTITKVNGYASDLGRNVFVWRPLPVPEEVLPCAILRDTVSPTQETFGEHLHRMATEVEVIGAGTDAPEQVRAMVADITKAIGTDRTFGSLVQEVNPVSEDFQVEQASKKLGSALLRFEVIFTTTPWNPDA